MMKEKYKVLMIEQLDKKMSAFYDPEVTDVPQRGWIYTIRKAFNMTRKQLAHRMRIKPQSLMGLEEREKLGTITLKSLRQMAAALDMKLVYGFVPNDGSLQLMIEKRAAQLAREIVGRTHNTMILEDQKVSDERIKKNLEEKTEELVNTIPSYLWD